MRYLKTLSTAVFRKNNRFKQKEIIITANEVNYNIRFAIKADMRRIIDLCEEHADFENASYNRRGKSSQLINELFYRSRKRLYLLVVETNNSLVGYASFMKQYSTWDACDYIYLDCIYLKEESRGFGIGKKLMQRLYQESKILNCSHIQWQTPQFNTRAIKFYKEMGAKSKAKERFFWE